MEYISKDILVTLFTILSCGIRFSKTFNVGLSGAKVFSGPVSEEFGYTVQQFIDHKGKWLLVGSPRSGFPLNQRGDVYRCQISGAKTNCDKLNLENSVRIPSVRNINANMSLGLTLTPLPKTNGFMTCGPLWAQQCGSQYFYPGICSEVSPLFIPMSTFSPAVQTCGGPMDIAIVLDGSNSIWPWYPIVDFLKKLLPTLDIGPDNTQVSIIQYAVDPSFEFTLNAYKTKEEVIAAASRITQKHGGETNTFHAIDFARVWAFLPENGGRAGASKVMVVVTDGESHDKQLRNQVIQKCEERGITRFGIAVLGYYIRNEINTKNLIKEIKSIASVPAEKYFFNVSAEAALSEIAGTLGERIFNIEGTGKGGDFQMEMAQVGFSSHYSIKEDVLMLGAVGAYGWSGTVIHQTGKKANIFSKKSFEKILEDRNHSSLLGYSVTTLNDGSSVYYVAGAPRANHSGQVLVYTMDTQKKPRIIDSEKGEQIGCYFGSVLCPLDVDKDGVSDVLLIGAPMFMTDQKREEGRVYLYSVTKGILSAQGFLYGPSTSENARFGMAISAVPDLNLDGFSDVVVGAPLENGNRGAIYIYNGNKKTVHKQHSQKILGEKLDPKLQYFGRSLDANGDLNGDSIPDVSVGAYGNVVQLWSRGLATVKAKVTFTPDKIIILSKPCNINGRQVSCFQSRTCFSATFMPKTTVGPLAMTYKLTLDADLGSSRVSSRGLFSQTNERFLQRDIQIYGRDVCEDHQVYVQEAPDFMNSIGLRVDIDLQKPDASPVLDAFSPKSWEFSVPFSKDCGADEVCVGDLVLDVKRDILGPSNMKRDATDREYLINRIAQAMSSYLGTNLRVAKHLLSLCTIQGLCGEFIITKISYAHVSPVLVTPKNRRLSFNVMVTNRKENAYNTRVIATFSKNLFYASITPPSDGTDVKCTANRETQVLSCQVAYPALRKDQQVTFGISFDFNLKQLQNEALVSFEAKSDSREERPADNKVDISIPVQYDSEIILTRKTNINFYVVDQKNEVKPTVKNYNDIGPEFSFTLKVSTVNFPVSLVFLTMSVPVTTKGGNPLLYVTGVSTQLGGAVSCEVNGLIDPLNISRNPFTPSFSKENLRTIKELNCETVACSSMKCVLKDMGVKNNYFVNVTSRIWNGTFVSSTFQSINLTVSAEIETSQPELLVITRKTLPVQITITKPGEIGDLPIGVIVGSILGGLLLLAVAVLVLWKLGFFKSKYAQLRKEAEEAGANADPQQSGAGP